MFFSFKYHLKYILILLIFILLGCQLQEPAKNHGILFLENRSNVLKVNKTNKNDVIKILGQPHAKTFDNDSIWIYITGGLNSNTRRPINKGQGKTGYNRTNAAGDLV